MKEKKAPKKEPASREPYKRKSIAEKRKIVQEVQSGLIGQRAAARKYGISRQALIRWLNDFAFANLKPKELADETITSMTENTKTKILARQVQELTKALEKAQLKITGLQTLIEVSEQELQIKIRKKPGTKQSKE